MVVNGYIDKGCSKVGGKTNLRDHSTVDRTWVRRGALPVYGRFVEFDPKFVWKAKDHRVHRISEIKGECLK